MPARRSDRWITPGVVVWFLVLGTVLLLAVIAAVVFLTARGLDPDPMVRLVANVGAAVGTLGTFVLQLQTRRTTTNVERKAGHLEAAVVETLEELEARTGRHAAGPVLEDQAQVIDPGTRPHPFMGAAPVPPRRIGQDSLDAETRQGPPERRGVR